ncbi:MAG: Sua5/YciO/YrdC/YwlC family protein, partial [Bacteroidales bacterium]
TFIYPTAQNLPEKLIHSDGTIAIRIVQNTFCKKLIQAIERPIISTSANLSSAPSPATFSEISPEIINSVDYVVPEFFSDSTDYKPSRLIKFLDDYNFVIIRE